METDSTRSRVTGTLTLDAGRATINGRPALTLEGVQQWFRDAFHVVPEANAVAPIAQAVNHCAFLESEWKRTRELDEMRRRNPSMLRMRRIAEALATLRNDLPVLIEDTRKVMGDKQSEGLAAVVALLEAVKPLATGFQKFRQRGAGREVDPWHNIARNLRPLILEVLKSAGIKRAGFGKIKPSRSNSKISACLPRGGRDRPSYCRGHAGEADAGSEGWENYPRKTPDFAGSIICQKVATLGRQQPVAMRRERLYFNIWRIVEGEAEGRFAIGALVGVVVATLLFVWLVK